MSEMKHTPLPWHADHLASYIWCESAKGGERPVVDIRGWGYLTGSGHGAIGLPPADARQEQEAVAAYIVTACNAFPDLVEALAVAQSTLRAIRNDASVADSIGASLAADKIDAALAKAGQP